MPHHRAASVLRAPHAAPALVAVSVVALTEAVHQRLDIPTDTARILWIAVRRTPSTSWCSTATDAISVIAEEPLIRDVLAVALDPSSGPELTDAALDVLSGARSAAFVTDADLLSIAERVHGRLAQRAANTIRSICDRRRVPQDIPKTIAERWLGRAADTKSRVAALDVVSCVDRDDAKTIIERALSDSDARVRSAGALTIAETDLDPQDAHEMIASVLHVETNNGVITDLLAAKTDLLLREDRSA